MLNSEHHLHYRQPYAHSHPSTPHYRYDPLSRALWLQFQLSVSVQNVFMQPDCVTPFPNHDRCRALGSRLLKARTLQADRGSFPTAYVVHIEPHTPAILQSLTPKPVMEPLPSHPAVIHCLAATTAPLDSVATARPNFYLAFFLQNSLEVNLTSRGGVL
ncbi:hypothetical protein PMIN01_03201 [Paraphaeosphaeria minitans]|uniref:Uncharacterized protein n=1 Tax=Paraphaeosphaeria minitans TaxID=565426 RepID=A0A9P6KSJ8_9PLEO|nr:hypothetical protein PMIN01_03201 [Paraphaeosphaeria minitans]